jgi:regulator of protease activity HflC (stomatin/prohibitin superfamily)
MPGTFLWAIIITALTLALGLYARLVRSRAKDDADVRDARAVARIAAAVLGATAVILVLVSAWNPVGTRDIGIVTSFGQPVGHIGPGANFTAPWEQVTSMDEAVQVTDVVMTVKIAGQQIAKAPVAVRWKIVAGASDDIFQNYRNSTSGVENALLLPELNRAMNTVYDGYDPIAPLATGAPAGSPSNPTTAQLADQVQALLGDKVGADIQVITLVIQPLQYSGTVQERINSVLAQVAKTDVAKQSDLTAQAQAQANKDIQKSLAGNPLALVQQCMNALADGAFTPPAGFSCWPGAGSGVVIPSAGK